MLEHPENGYRLVEKVQKKKLKFDSIFFTDEDFIDKENLIYGRKVQDQMFKNSIRFWWKINWVYEGFDCKKNWFVRL